MDAHQSDLTRGAAPARPAALVEIVHVQGLMSPAAAASAASPTAEPSTLRRVLGLPTLTFFGVGMILGAGIYAVIGAAAAQAGPLLWMSFLAAAVVALLTGLSYAELAAIHPRAAAEYVYIESAVPRAPALALGTALLVALSGIATSATVALAFSSYLSGLLGWEARDVTVMSREHLVALALVVVCFGVALAGILHSSWVNVIFTLVEASGLVLVVVLGFTAEGSGTGTAPIAAPSWGVLAGAGLVFFSFLGFENIATLAEEAKEPKTQVPRAILLSVVVSAALYVLVAIAAVLLLPPEKLAASSTPLTAAVQGQSDVAARALSVIALFATANTCLGSLVVTSRLLFGIAEQRALPRALARTGRTRTPWVALLLAAGVAAALTFFGKVPVVASLSSFASLVAFLVVNVAVIVLRKREPDTERPFRVPLSIGGVPVPAVLGALATIALVFALERTAQLAGLVAIGVVGVVAVGLSGTRTGPAAGKAVHTRRSTPRGHGR